MSSPESPPTVYCPSSLTNWTAALEASGWHVEPIEGAVPAERARNSSIVLVDGDAAGDALVSTIGKILATAGARVVVIGRDTSPTRIVTAIRSGAVDYLARSGGEAPPADLAARLHALPETMSVGTDGGLEERLNDLVQELRHDVKNPINNILGYTELLLDIPTTQLTGDQSEFVTRIRANGLQILEILERITSRK